MNIEKIKKEFDKKFLTEHQGCDDGWYACPKSEDYFGEYEKLSIEKRPCFCPVENDKPKLWSFFASHYKKIYQKGREDEGERINEYIKEDNEFYEGSEITCGDWEKRWWQLLEQLKNI